MKKRALILSAGRDYGHSINYRMWIAAERIEMPRGRKKEGDEEIKAGVDKISMPRYTPTDQYEYITCELFRRR